MSHVLADMSVAGGGYVTGNTTVPVGRSQSRHDTYYNQVNGQCSVSLEREIRITGYSHSLSCLVDNAWVRFEFTDLISLSMKWCQ